jgi:hypothetical protein
VTNVTRQVTTGGISAPTGPAPVEARFGNYRAGLASDKCWSGLVAVSLNVVAHFPR